MCSSNSFTKCSQQTFYFTVPRHLIAFIFFSASFLSIGTHWCYEIVDMLRNNSSEFTKHMPPLIDMLPVEKLMQVPDGVLVSHLLPQHMPKDATQKRCKLVHIYRNPKDVIVSFFNFLKKTKEGAMMQDMEFDVFFDLYITDQCKLFYLFIY